MDYLVDDYVEHLADMKNALVCAINTSKQNRVQWKIHVWDGVREIQVLMQHNIFQIAVSHVCGGRTSGSSDMDGENRVTRYETHVLDSSVFAADIVDAFGACEKVIDCCVKGRYKQEYYDEYLRVSAQLQEKIQKVLACEMIRVLGKVRG